MDDKSYDSERHDSKFCRQRTYTNPDERSYFFRRIKDRDKRHRSMDDCSVKDKCKCAQRQKDKKEREIYEQMKTMDVARFSYNSSERRSSRFTAIICCRRSRRESPYAPDVNVVTTYPPDCNEYSKLQAHSSAYSSIRTESSGVMSQTSMSDDSGFTEDTDESTLPPTTCYIRTVYPEHTCKGRCLKKLSLNIHLRQLQSRMPKSFCDSEAIPCQLANCSGVKRDTYLSRRRHAICETSEEMKAEFFEALSSFLTLKAMSKYDFL